MKKADKYFVLSCYRYAPEQFKAYQITGFSDTNKKIPKYNEISLTHNERFQCGYAMCCKGTDAALAELKHILRQRKHNAKHYYTIGYRSKNGNEYIYIRQLRFEEYNLKSAYAVYKEIKEYMEAHKWRVQQSSSVKLDGRYRPIKETVTESYLEIDRSRPLLIYFKQGN